MLNCAAVSTFKKERVLASQSRIKWAETAVLMRDTNIKARLMAATKLMLVSVLMFFEQCYFENANSEAEKKTNPEMLYKEEKKKKVMR